MIGISNDGFEAWKRDFLAWQEKEHKWWLQEVKAKGIFDTDEIKDRITTEGAEDAKQYEELWREFDRLAISENNYFDPLKSDAAKGKVASLVERLDKVTNTAEFKRDCDSKLDSLPCKHG